MKLKDKLSNKLDKIKEFDKRLKTHNKETLLRFFVIVLSVILLIHACYYSYVAISGTNDNDISWYVPWYMPWYMHAIYNFIAISRIITSIFGYLGAFLKIKKFLIINLIIIIIDISLSVIFYFFSFTQLFSSYQYHIDKMTNMPDMSHIPDMAQREIRFNIHQCNFLITFRRRIMENLILVSFSIIHAMSIVNLVQHINKLDLLIKIKFNKIQTRDPGLDSHLRCSILSLAVIYLSFAIYLLVKTYHDFDSQHNSIFMTYSWTIISIISIIISLLTTMIVFVPGCVCFVGLVSMLWVFKIITFTYFILIIFKDMLKDNDYVDYYCSEYFQIADSLASIFTLFILNQILIAFLSFLSQQIKFRNNWLEWKNKLKQ